MVELAPHEWKLLRVFGVLTERMGSDQRCIVCDIADNGAQHTYTAKHNGEEEIWVDTPEVP